MMKSIKQQPDPSEPIVEAEELGRVAEEIENESTRRANFLRRHGIRIAFRRRLQGGTSYESKGSKRVAHRVSTTKGGVHHRRNKRVD